MTPAKPLGEGDRCEVTVGPRYEPRRCGKRATAVRDGHRCCHYHLHATKAWTRSFPPPPKPRVDPRNVLRRLEWSGEHFCGVPCCPICLGLQREPIVRGVTNRIGHEKGCVLAQAIGAKP